MGHGTTLLNRDLSQTDEIKKKKATMGEGRHVAAFPTATDLSSGKLDKSNDLMKKNIKPPYETRPDDPRGIDTYICMYVLSCK